jgi:hypothetical protein
LIQASSSIESDYFKLSPWIQLWCRSSFCFYIAV